jgi:hypothetical protein
MKTAAAWAIALFAGIGTAAAQPAGPYVAGHAGTSGGDGGGAIVAGAAVGYMSPRRLAFELEISVRPGLDIPTPDAIVLAIYPAPTFEGRGRMVWLQTNAVATVVDAGKLRAAVVAGGGAVNLHREITYSLPLPIFSGGITLPVLPALPFPYENRRVTSAETALALNAGGIVDYAVTRRLRVGVDARYEHAFFSDAWKTARVAARAQWGF